MSVEINTLPDSSNQGISSNIKPNLGDRMKSYESITTQLRISREDILIVRLDGRSFSSFTRSLKKEGPFHSGFTTIMKEVTYHLVNTYNPIIGYTQSDEITLVFINSARSEHPFGGRVFKIQSLMGADASLYFNSLLLKHIPEKAGSFAMFDCRAFSVPSLSEAYECLIWRQKDGYRNAVSAVARLHFSVKQLHGKKRKEQLAMLLQKGVDFDDSYHITYRYGTFYVRESELRTFTATELSALPPKHKAHSAPSLLFSRSIVKEIPFSEIKAKLTKISFLLSKLHIEQSH